jgi:hypothetical protein
MLPVCLQGGHAAAFGAEKQCAGKGRHRVVIACFPGEGLSWSQFSHGEFSSAYYAKEVFMSHGLCYVLKLFYPLSSTFRIIAVHLPDRM